MMSVSAMMPIFSARSCVGTARSATTDAPPNARQSTGAGSLASHGDVDADPPPGPAGAPGSPGPLGPPGLPGSSIGPGDDVKPQPAINHTRHAQRMGRASHDVRAASLKPPDAGGPETSR